MEITTRERQVLQLISEEYTSKEIAKILFLSTQTIHSHRRNIMIKLNAKNTAGVVSKAYRQGLMTVGCIAFFLLQGIFLYAQSRNLYVEGSGDQYGVIRTTSTESSKSGLELLRGNEFTSTDWRIQNDNGSLKFENGKDNFLTTPDMQMRINKGGVVNMFNGTNALPNDNESGTLILGDPTNLHLAIDNNGIIARNNEIGSRLLIQTGLNQGDTYLNDLSGDVGIGTLEPAAKLGVEDNGFQMSFGNTEQLDNDWYIGASHEGWNIGGSKFVISPSTSSGNAMLVLDNENDIIDVRSNRVIRLEDPINERDAVNLRTLISYAKITEISRYSQTGHDFEECASKCRTLSENGHDDWKIPSLEEAAQFVDNNESSVYIWTSSSVGFATYLRIRLEDGLTTSSHPSTIALCRCVR